MVLNLRDRDVVVLPEMRDHALQDVALLFQRVATISKPTNKISR